MTAPRQARLPRVGYLAFPFRMTPYGGALSDRTGHVREQIEQVLFTSPGERVFRPGFGFGARAAVFEPNRSALWELARTRLYAALAEALAGEVDPKSIRVAVGADPEAPERLLVSITYTLAAIRKEERHEIVL
jgi:phage baseplate assembly protein W